MSNRTVSTDPATVEQSDRLRDRLPSPTLLATLGLLGVPSLFVPALEWTEEFFAFFLFALWPIVKAVTPSVGDGSPTDWITMGTRSPLSTLASIAYIQLNPVVQATSLGQIAGVVPVVVRHRFRLPDVESFEQSTDYRLPVEGEWTVVAGGATREHSHSWGILTQRYAYDLVVTDDDGYSHEGDGRDLGDYYCFGEPVVAPADGDVVDVRDGHRDYHRPGGWLDPLQRDIRGNYVVVDHGGGEYSTLAHLQEGSVRVSEGDRVERGQRVARCGNSGNSTEPHLHFHVADRPSLVFGMGLPVQFSNVRIRDPGERADEGTGVAGGRNSDAVGADGDGAATDSDAVGTGGEAAATDGEAAASGHGSSAYDRAYLRAGQRAAPAE